jgi:Sulfotransferase domain
MALEVIGAGFGRTGTESMKQALEILGLGPCHHMKEVMSNPAQLALWRAVARGELPDWDEAFAGYRSAVDWPSAYFWREVSAHYPEAKVLLTVRSAESWYESMDRTILPVLRTSTDPDSIGLRLIARRVFGGRLDDRAHAIAVYEKNIADVQAAFPPERLLTCRLGDGWQPLCRFLGKPVPDVPYPQSNSTEQFRADAATRRQP